MDHGPAQWEEHHPIPLEVELVKFPYGRSAHAFNLGENCLDLHVNQLISPGVGDSKLESGLVTIRRDDGIATVNDSRGWPRETGKHQPGGECNADDVQECLDSHKDVRRDPDGDDIAVADRSKRVNAEEERPIERLP